MLPRSCRVPAAGSALDTLPLGTTLFGALESCGTRPAFRTRATAASWATPRTSGVLVHRPPSHHPPKAAAAASSSTATRMVIRSRHRGRRTRLEPASRSVCAGATPGCDLAAVRSSGRCAGVVPRRARVRREPVDAAVVPAAVPAAAGRDGGRHHHLVGGRHGAGRTPCPPASGPLASCPPASCPRASATDRPAGGPATAGAAAARGGRGTGAGSSRSPTWNRAARSRPRNSAASRGRSSGSRRVAASIAAAIPTGTPGASNSTGGTSECTCW